MKDKLLAWIERISGRIYRWAWKKRWKERNPDEWIKGYKELKKQWKDLKVLYRKARKWKKITYQV